MRLRIIISLALILAACSSTNKSKSSSGEVAPTQANVEANSSAKEAKPDVQPAPPPMESAPTKAVVSARKASIDALTEAIKSGAQERIAKAATDCLMLNSNDIRALNAMGLVYYKKSQQIAARLFFNKALGLKPNNSEILSNIGLTYQSEGEEFKAIQYFRKAIENNPNDINAIVNLSSIYLQHRDFAKAYSAMSFNKSSSNDLKYLNNLAMAQAARGNLDQAESAYKQALKIAPNNREVLFNYAIFQVDYLKKYKQGLETLDHLRFIGLAENMKNLTKDLENRAKAGLK